MSIHSRDLLQSKILSTHLQRKMAGPTRLELATSGVTGRRSNQLNYDPDIDYLAATWWAVQDLNL
jgi:hypothetical protein